MITAFKMTNEEYKYSDISDLNRLLLSSKSWEVERWFTGINSTQVVKEEYKYSDITEKIIGCAMRIHQRMRNGYQELIYHRCLVIELEKASVGYSNEIELPIFYDGIQVGKRRVDFLVDNKVIVEIKALSELTSAHLAQALNYLEVMNLEVGLLINFGSKSLEIKRLVNSKVKQVANPSSSNKSNKSA